MFALKKFLSNLLIFVALLLISLVAIPWNNLGQWSIPMATVLQNNELYLKAGAAGVLFLFSLVFLIISFREQSMEGRTSQPVVNASVLPLWMFGVGATVYAAGLAAFAYTQPTHLNPTYTSTILYVVIGIGFVFLNLVGFGHMIPSGFRTRKVAGKILLFVLLLELAGIAGGLAYFVRMYVIANYATLYTYNHIIILAVAIGIYLIHLILQIVKKNRATEEELLETEVTEMEKPQKSMPTPKSTSFEEPSPRPEKKSKKSALEPIQDPRKTFIVSKEQSISSQERGVDPTNMLYEEVPVDPEFTKVSSQSQATSIDYYIEKPKMFKPLDPTFDLLVEYVRDLPGVVTKISDEKITFYRGRSPFLVLMNYGNYYRMAFRYELEKGIRLIIKYPTISKNKSTKDEVWFKANNYGDLPKEVIYEIVKTSFDTTTA